MAVTGQFNEQRLLTISLTGLLTAASSANFILHAAETAMVQVTGTFGAATVAIEASNDGGVTWVPASTTLSAAGATGISVPFNLYRATVVGGGGTTLLNCYITARISQ